MENLSLNESQGSCTKQYSHFPIPVISLALHNLPKQLTPWSLQRFKANVFPEAWNSTKLETQNPSFQRDALC